MALLPVEVAETEGSLCLSAAARLLVELNGLWEVALLLIEAAEIGGSLCVSAAARFLVELHGL